MEHMNPTPNLRAIEHSGDSFCAFQPQLKQAGPQRLAMWLAQVRAHQHHSTRQHDVSGGQGIGQHEDALFYSLAVVVDGVVHSGSI